MIFDSPTPHLVLDDVAFAWPGGVRLERVRMTVQRGDFCLLTGPSGTGKSTLLRLLTRLETPDAGRLFYDGKPLESLDPTRLRRSMALVAQEPYMGGGSVREALLLPYGFAANADLPRPEEAALREQLDRLHLADVRLEATAESLSLGQRQRVALARQLLLQPAMLLLDEPTSALDAESRRLVEHSLEAAHADGVTVIMITHTDYRPACAHRVFVLQHGELVEQDAPDASARTGNATMEAHA